MDIIGLSGRKGVGKDTVGRYLVERYGFTRVSFAEPLKVSAAAVFDIDPASFEETKNDPDATITYRDRVGSVTITVREYLQRYGTEAHRDVFGQDFWTRSLFDRLDPEGGPYVITDTRFDNEHIAVKAAGGVNVRIVRLGEDVVVDTHSSEADPNPVLIDAFIDNAGTFEELYASVDAVMVDVCGWSSV